MSFSEILSSPILKNTLKSIFGDSDFDIVERPGSYVILMKTEPDEKIRRVIVLKPRGFTANSPGELSSHPEAREATIEIRGAVRPGNVGYLPIKDCVEFVYLLKSDADIVGDYPYASADSAWRTIRTSRTRFRVVKNGSFGFYHNLINLTDEWIVLVMDKKLNQKFNVDLSMLEGIGKEDSNTLHRFYDKIAMDGDAIFEDDKGLVKRVVSIDPKISIPILINFLNIPEEGRHEQCSVFVAILKVGKRDAGSTVHLLKEAMKHRVAPQYYLRELVKKLSFYI